MKNNQQDDIDMFRDISVALSCDSEVLCSIYSGILSRGVVHTVDIRQLASLGVPIYQELAKVLGIRAGEVNGFIAQGEVRLLQLNIALKNMTNPGGIFNGIADKQKNTLTYQMRNTL